LLPLFKNKLLLTEYIQSVKQNKQVVGLVPTMGALHAGHISLINKSCEESNVTVCSIFVNPTQFNEKSDFEKYPRLLEKDMHMLENTKCNAIFAPEIKEVYGKDTTQTIDADLGYLNLELEAKFRSGHFDGVVTIVKKLFDIVQPDIAYFGQKDFQQFMTIKKLVEYFEMPIKLVSCPVIRENDGLAMSSRNLLLTAEERAFAPTIYQTLNEAKELLDNKSIQEIQQWAEKKLSQEKLVEFEYFEIRNAEDLKPVNDITKTDELVILTAIRVGKIRLIDNILVKT
jgi:pantoate--beta-alanine ligase